MSLPDVRLQIAATTLAEELNFTRAAERLRITQPALSKRISELEERIGFAIFSREQKRVEITEAGQVFIRGCRDSQAILEKAIRAAKATQSEAQPIITIGHSPYVCPLLMSAVLGVHLPIFSNLRLRMETMFPNELIHGLNAGELDLALIEEPLENPLITMVKVSTKALYALMPSDHAAAMREYVQISDFRNVGWIVFAKRANPSLYDRLMEDGRQAGITPLEIHHYMTPQEVVQLIRENLGVAFMPMEIAKQLQDTDLIARPFASDALQINTYMALAADQPSRLVNGFGRALLRSVGAKLTSSQGTNQLALDL